MAELFDMKFRLGGNECYYANKSQSWKFGGYPAYPLTFEKFTSINLWMDQSHYHSTSNAWPVLENKQLSAWGLGLLEVYGKNNN